ncbi:hypothetical protein BV20DRAFT_1017169 [Pilatotrama ljubarskyi]|nr:hypothetical protein BV20DRAFT_1017169 [Pilatotrama ljubarskyi]
MPPRKKQKTDADHTQAASSTTESAVPTRRVTRASTRGQSNVQQQPSTRRKRSVAKKATSDALHADAPPAAKRIVRKGRLQSLPDFALEVQLEIYNYLEPQDLLHLSRTCKKFRAFFLDRKLNEPLWRQARQNLSADALPPRPPFMSEPAFIHLLYSPHCHNCGAPNVRKILPACFMRCCSKCLPERTVWYRDAVDAARDIHYNFTYMFDYRSVESYCPLLEKTYHSHDERGNRLLLDHVTHLLDECRAVPAPITTEAIGALQKRLREEYRERLRFARPIHNWLQAREEERKVHLGDSRKQRFEEIVLRLREGGWNEELDFIGEDGIEKMSKFPVVRQSSKLTEGAWQKVLAALETYLNDTRKARLDKEYRTAIRARFDALDEAIAACYVTLPRTARMDCRPQPIDLAFTPECKAIIDVPTSETVTAANFASLLPKMLAKWEADRKKELTKFFRKVLGKIPAGVDPLELAIASFPSFRELPGAFQCNGAIECMRYPAIFAHTCCYNCFRSRPVTKEELENDDRYTCTVKSLKWSEKCLKGLERPYHGLRAYVPFTLAELEEHPDIVQRVVAQMRKIVSALGLDPMRATFEELEACDTWLRCRTCETSEVRKYEPRQKVYAYSWRGAFEHDYRCSHYAAKNWRRADEEDYVKIRAALKEASERSIEWASRRHYDLKWSCSLCPVFVGDKWEISDHLANSHGIEEPGQAETDGTIYVHPAWDQHSLRPDEVFLYKRAVEQEGRCR